MNDIVHRQCRMETNMKKINIIFITIVMSFLTAIGCQIIFSKDITFSADENRYLAKKPEVSIDRILSKDFQNNMDNFMSDQIPFRNQFMVSATVLKKMVGIRNINDAYIGRQGYYFEKITDDDIDEKRFEKNLKFINDFLKRHSSLEFKVMLVPGSGNILTEYLPKAAKVYDYNGLITKAETVIGEENIIALEDSLKKEAKTHSLSTDTGVYYKTDHHWTSVGAYIGYREFAKASDKKIKAYDVKKLAEDFYGTLYSKVMDLKKGGDVIYGPKEEDSLRVCNGIKETKSIYVMDKKNAKDKYQIFFGGNFGQVDIATKQKNKNHLLVIKDSFANSFVPYILGDYDTITMVDLRNFAGNIEMIMKEKKITEILVLYEMSNFATDTNIYKISL